VQCLLAEIYNYSTMLPTNTLTLLLSFAFLITYASADVTIIPSGFNLPHPHKAKNPISSTADLLYRAASDEFKSRDGGKTAFQPPILISSNITLSTKSGLVYPSSDSFIRGAIEAWGQHQHLLIRPEDVWFTILVQMNFYMTANAEKVRSIFVSHAGKDPIVIISNGWYEAIRQFGVEIQKRVKTSWLLEWIEPDFSTTTESDKMTANVLMMGLMQAYFDYIAGIVCGLPSVTLLGEKKDWERLLGKLDRLVDFGVEPAQYGKKLRPILTRFVKSFDAPGEEETRKFWSEIVHAKPGSGPICGSPGVPYLISGWITAFHHWDDKGALVNGWEPNGPYSLDGVNYSSVSILSLPVAYAKAPITLLDVGKGYVIAGMLGKKITTGAPKGYADRLRQANLSLPATITEETQNSLSPLSAWAVYIDENNSTAKRTGKAELNDLAGMIPLYQGEDGCSRPEWMTPW
jgi:Domain of unknown function (DUF4419)